jgi:predicted DNA-binding protein (MmcQ/YjbR family)
MAKKAAKKKSSTKTARKTKGTSDLRDHCHSLAGVEEDIKWTEHLIFSVRGKMFASFDIDDSPQVGILCDDDDFDDLLERGEASGKIIPAPYAARLGWVRVLDRRALPVGELRALLTKAHAIAASKLPKKTQRELGLID